MRGFQLQQSEIKILAYAYDIAVFCADKKSISEVIKLMRVFCDATGAAVNMTRCSGFWHGAWATKPEVFEGFNWSETQRKYLGVPLEYYKNSNKHWCEAKSKPERKVHKWGGREMSIFARATVCNTFLVAKLMYVFQVLACSRICIQSFHRVFAKFIWKVGIEPMSRDNIFRPVNRGGLGLSHLYFRQIVARFVFLRDQNSTFLCSALQITMPDLLPSFIMSSFCAPPTKRVGF